MNLFMVAASKQRLLQLVSICSVHGGRHGCQRLGIDPLQGMPAMLDANNRRRIRRQSNISQNTLTFQLLTTTASSMAARFISMANQASTSSISSGSAGLSCDVHSHQAGGDFPVSQERPTSRHSACGLMATETQGVSSAVSSNGPSDFFLDPTQSRETSQHKQPDGLEHRSEVSSCYQRPAAGKQFFQIGTPSQQSWEAPFSDCGSSSEASIDRHYGEKQMRLKGYVTGFLDSSVRDRASDEMSIPAPQAAAESTVECGVSKQLPGQDGMLRGQEDSGRRVGDAGCSMAASSLEEPEEPLLEPSRAIPQDYIVAKAEEEPLEVFPASSCTASSADIKETLNASRLSRPQTDANSVFGQRLLGVTVSNPGQGCRISAISIEGIDPSSSDWTNACRSFLRAV